MTESYQKVLKLEPPREFCAPMEALFLGADLMEEKKAKRKLTAILSADVKGYSRLMQDDEEGTVRTITAYREVMTDRIKGHDGRVVDAKGDNVLAEFPSVVDAVRCGVEIQKELKEKNAELPEKRRMEFRIGINLGDVIEKDDTIYGDGVNIAARIEGLAEGGGICISGTAYDQVKNKIDLAYEYLGEHTVKNIAEPLRIYRIPAEIETLIPKPSRVFELPEKPSIAVLPFANLSGDPQQEYIADGITENIITALSQISEMFVIARNSVFAYKERPVKVQQVSEELGVRHVLEGSVLKAGDRVRITAQLVDATIGHHLWAEQYDRDMTGFFDLLDEITYRIVVSLQVELTEGEQARVRHKSTSNLRAWGYAVRGYGLCERYRKEDNTKARQFFERAVELDPEYAWAWTFLAWTHFFDARWAWSESPAESFERCIEIAQKAVALDESSPEVHALLGGIYLFQKKHEQAIAEGEKSIALGPSNAETHAVLAHQMYYAGRPEEAIALVRKAMRLQPYYPAWYLWLLGGSHGMAGRYEEELEAYKQLLERSRKGEFSPLGVHLCLVSAYMRLGREEEARAQVEEVLRIDPNFSLEWLRKIHPYKDPTYLKRSMNRLRRAGLR